MLFIITLPATASFMEETLSDYNTEFEKHNRELRRVKKYLKTKRQKDDFEYYLYLNFNSFFYYFIVFFKPLKARSASLFISIVFSKNLE